MRRTIPLDRGRIEGKTGNNAVASANGFTRLKTAENSNAQCAYPSDGLGGRPDANGSDRLIVGKALA